MPPDRHTSCGRLVEMVRNALCAGSEVSFDYLMNWLAWKVQMRELLKTNRLPY